MIESREPSYEYRSDGWPLCPGCGVDSLVSTSDLSARRRAHPTDAMKCLACDWTGTVPGLVPR